MNIRLKEAKRAIRRYLTSAYSDDRLAWLLAHARHGRLSYQSCCCLIGAATSDHALRGRTSLKDASSPHYIVARQFVGAQEAERGYYSLGVIGKPWRLTQDELRRRRVIPMLLAEMRRREAARRRVPSPAPVPVGVRLRLCLGRPLQSERH